MKFQYFNDTNRMVSIHSASFLDGCTADMNEIAPLTTCTFHLPDGTYPWVKMWDYGELGLSILVSPIKDSDDF